MDPHHNPNWPPQAYASGQYVPYTPQQQQQQQQQQQFANGHHRPTVPPQYVSMQGRMPQGYAQPHPQQPHPQPTSQQYPGMHQAYLPPLQQQQQPRAQPQVVIPPKQPPKHLHYVSPMQQMQPPKIRHVQTPVHRTSSTGVAQTDGSGDRRRYSNQQAPTPPQSKQVQRSQSHQKNSPRPQQQQQPAHATPQNHHSHRAPLQQQSTPQQHVSSSSQTPSSQQRSPSVHAGSKPKAHPQVVIPARPSSHLLTPSKRAHVPSKALPADLSVMLLSAADEYIAAARGMGVLLLRNRRDADVEQYHKLMATGLGCMDTVLREFNMLPRDEAKLRLRYASLLIEETDNTTEIDEVLSKQISLCGRCRLQDLKYGALHLQARYQFKTNRRAALKSLDKPISEAETFQHIAWVYAFRFLKVSLALQVPGRIEVASVLQQLRSISAHAERRGDRAVYVACNVFEALVHLRSGAADRVEQAQRAIATARSHQLQLSAEQLGSFGILLNMNDLVCGIQSGVSNNPNSVALMSDIVDSTKPDTSGSDYGIVTLAIGSSAGEGLTTDTGGIFRKNAAGGDELVFAWLPDEDVHTLCAYVCAVDQHAQTRGFGYLKDAHQAAKLAVNRPMSRGMPVSLAVAQQNWNDMLDWHVLVAISLTSCYRQDKAYANEALEVLKKRVTKLPRDSGDMYNLMLSYVSAVCEQGNGSLDSALRTYCSSAFQLPAPGAVASTKSDLAILAALNRLLIVRHPKHPQHDTVTALLAQVKLFCEDHCNQYIQMAYRLSNAMSYPDTAPDASIKGKRTNVQAAANRARSILHKTGNREFITMALSYLCETFFIDTTTEKGPQAASAVRQHSKASKSPLWMAVAAGLCMHNFQLNGLIKEAQEAQREYESLMHLLPASLPVEADVDAEGDDDDAEGEDDDD